MRIQVQINFGTNENTQIRWHVLIPAGTNMSNYTKVLTDGSRGFKGFQLSASSSAKTSTLGNACYMYPETGYPGLITQAMSAGDKTVSMGDVEFYMYGEVPSTLYVSFDPTCREYATSFTLANSQNSTTISIVNNVNCTVSIPLASMNLTDISEGILMTLSITKWNVAYASIKITRISTYYVGTTFGSDLKDFSCSENLFNSQMEVQPGICEQYADLKIYDRSNIIHQLALEGKLSDGGKITLFAIDDSTQTTHELGTYSIDTWDVPATSSTVSVTCKDKSILFEKINISSLPVTTRSVDNMLDILFIQAGLPWDYIDSTTLLYCMSIVTPDSWFYMSSLYELLNKVCALGMLRIYWYIDKFIVARCW